MANPFIGEIIMFGGNFAPRGWALCDGQLLPISSNSALFSILGTMYGGDGRTTFALPDCRGRVAIHPGTGPGLSPYQQGKGSGHETVTLTQNQMPSHTHTMNVDNNTGNAKTASGHIPASYGTPGPPVASGPWSSASANATAKSGTLANTGGGQSFSIVQPWVGVQFIIALQGTYPSRS